MTVVGIEALEPTRNDIAVRLAQIPIEKSIAPGFNTGSDVSGLEKVALTIVLMLKPCVWL